MRFTSSAFLSLLSIELTDLFVLTVLDAGGNGGLSSGGLALVTEKTADEATFVFGNGGNASGGDFIQTPTNNSEIENTALSEFLFSALQVYVVTVLSIPCVTDNGGPGGSSLGGLFLDDPDDLSALESSV